MNNASVNEVSEIGNMKHFMQMMSTDSVGAEQRYDFDASDRLYQLKKEIKTRNGSERALDSASKFSAQFIVQQASERYFQLISSAIESLDSAFTASDMETILNANCSPFCQWSAGCTVSGMVADDLGIEQLSDLSDDSDLKLLIEKLMHLSPIQNVALVDVCERYWRSAKGNSVEEIFGGMNFVLA